MGKAVKRKVSKKTVINRNDSLCRAINRYKKCCERCSRRAPYQLHWSHVYGRRSKNLRWRESNHLLLCSTCHRWMHEFPTEFTQWFVDKFGAARQKKLQELYAHPQEMTVEDYLAINAQLKETLVKLERDNM